MINEFEIKGKIDELKKEINELEKIINKTKKRSLSEELAIYLKEVEKRLKRYEKEIEDAEKELHFYFLKRDIGIKEITIREKVRNVKEDVRIEREKTEALLLVYDGNLGEALIRVAYLPEDRGRYDLLQLILSEYAKKEDWYGFYKTLDHFPSVERKLKAVREVHLSVEGEEKKKTLERIIEELKGKLNTLYSLFPHVYKKF
jgi:DNA-binding transcriptional regulator GbsR (MarR family)